MITLREYVVLLKEAIEYGDERWIDFLVGLFDEAAFQSIEKTRF